MVFQLGDPQPDSHAGLCYEAGAPVGLEDGKIPDNRKPGWLGRFEAIRVPDGYREWFKDCWQAWLRKESYLLECVTEGPTLVGSGNASATDVGLHLHHTWGVPMVAGSAIKGLLSHYLDAVYGPDAVPPTDEQHPDPDRARFRRAGLSDADNRAASPPGEWQRVLFGSADYDDTTATAGRVVFHDMLFVPPNVDATKSMESMISVDVLTPHNADYYLKGRVANDYEDPTPVPFLCVPPGTHLLLAVGGSRPWAEFAIRRLAEAVNEWGVGAKTAAGYGRLRPHGDIRGPSKPTVVPAEVRTLRTAVDAWLKENQPTEDSQETWTGLLKQFVVAFAERISQVADDQEKKGILQPLNTAIAASACSRKVKKALREQLENL